MPLISRRWRLPAIILFVCLAALAVLSGPLFPFTPLPSDIAGVVAKAPDIDSYLSRCEAAHAGVKPGLAKTVIGNAPTARHKGRCRSSISMDSRPVERLSPRSSRAWPARLAPTPF